MPDCNGPLLATWEGAVGWYDPTRTTITDNRTRVRLIAQSAATDSAFARSRAEVSPFASLLRHRTRRIVRSLYG